LEAPPIASSLSTTTADDGSTVLGGHQRILTAESGRTAIDRRGEVMRPYRFGVLVLILTWSGVSIVGQTTHDGESRTSWTFDTHTPGPCSPTGARHGGCNPGDAVRIAVTTVADGLVQPWHMTFLPGTADVLVTELPGRLRILRNGVLDPAPVPGWPVPSSPRAAFTPSCCTRASSRTGPYS
jgi:hypothetical protein